jgi:hypothetical protein
MNKIVHNSVLLSLALIIASCFLIMHVPAGVIPPPKVAAIELEPLCNGTVQLYWSSSAGATGYRVYGSNNPTSGFILLATVLAPQTSYLDTNYVNYKVYYKVVAYNSGGNAPDSDPVSTYMYPAPAIGLSGSGESSSSIEIDWGSPVVRLLRHTTSIGPRA